MKKGISVLVLLALMTAGAFAQMSAGGGVLFDLSLNNGDKGEEYKYSLNNTSFGGFVFFDATYVEIDVGFAYGSLKYESDWNGSKFSGDAGSVMQLNLALLGKYPIDMGGFTLFPLLGVSYNRVLSSKDSNGNSLDNAGEESQIGFLLGVGADFNLTDSLYLRAEALFQLRLPSKQTKDYIEGTDAKATLGLGPVIKVALGYKF